MEHPAASNIKKIRYHLTICQYILSAIAIPALIVADIPNLYWPIVDNQHFFWSFVGLVLLFIAAVNSDTAHSLSWPTLLMDILVAAALWWLSPMIALILETSKCSNISSNNSDLYYACAAKLSADGVSAADAQSACLKGINIDVTDLATGLTHT